MKEKQLIYIDGITSISESIVSFTHNAKLIEAEPFPQKVKKNPGQDCNYHLDAEDLHKINELESTIFPYSSTIGMTKNQYINYMKNKWTNIILTGRLLPLLEHVNDRSYKLYEVKWSGAKTF